jgi:two-component system chemotaxis response regulator CheY
VMIIDDSRTVRALLRRLLSGAGYEVFEASDGDDGIERIRATPGLALVICDVNMPRMNGMDMVTELKRDPKTAALSVLMLTTESSRPSIEKARDLGAKGWVIKPFAPDQLLKVVQKLVGAG